MASFSPPTLTNYNDNSPPDDGSEALGNLVTWSGIKTELTDPISEYTTNLNNACQVSFATCATKTGTETLTNKTITSPEINNATGIGQTSVSKKGSSSTFTSSASLTDIGLTLSDLTAGYYSYEIYLDCNTMGGGGIQAQVQVNGGYHRSGEMVATQSDGTHSGMSSFSAGIFGISSSTLSNLATVVIIKGVISVATTNAITTKVAQYSSNASTLTVTYNSYIKVTRIN